MKKEKEVKYPKVVKIKGFYMPKKNINHGKNQTT